MHMVSHFFKRINQICYTFPNESPPLHNIVSSESRNFISVFIYTCIKVKLTKGEKEMASPRPSRTRPTDFLFWLQNMSNLSV